MEERLLVLRKMMSAEKTKRECVDLTRQCSIVVPSLYLSLSVCVCVCVGWRVVSIGSLQLVAVAAAVVVLLVVQSGGGRTAPARWAAVCSALSGQVDPCQCRGRSECGY